MAPVADDAADDGVRIRVAGFNIRNGIAVDWSSLWWRRRRSTSEALSALEADVVGLQEAYGFQRRWLADVLGNVAVAARGRDPGGGGEACPVLVDPARVAAIGGEVRWYGDQPDTPGSKLPGASHPRIAAIATLAHDGVGFTVVNTHLDQHHQALRQRSVEQLLGWVGEGPAVLLGDFNAFPDEPELAPLAAAGFRRVVLDGEEEGTSHGYRGHAHLIDHCFVSPHWNVIGGRIDRTRPQGRFPSDHWPIVVDLEFRS